MNDNERIYIHIIIKICDREYFSNATIAVADEIEFTSDPKSWEHIPLVNIVADRVNDARQQFAAKYKAANEEVSEEA